MTRENEAADSAPINPTIMRRFLPLLCTVSLLPSLCLCAENAVKPAETGTVGLFSGVSTPYNDTQLAKVSEWIRREAPAYPAHLVVDAAQRILDDLGMHHRDELEVMLAGGGNNSGFRSILLRHMAAVLVGAQYAEQREGLARLRVGAVLQGAEPGTVEPDLGALITKLKTASQVQHRRLAEGRVDDDELLSLLRKARGDAVRTERKALPKVISAADIASEFSRRNQVGSSVERLQAYSIEATMIPATGEPRQFLLFRLRPDRFRLVLRAGGVTKQIITSSGHGYWVQTAGQPSKAVEASILGDLVHLAEFVNPLLRQEGYGFTKLDDGVMSERQVYRIRVVRPGGSRYDSCIDKENYREIAREHPDGSVTRFSDFREAAGVTFAFREELTDTKNQKVVVEMKRIRTNHGIVQALFEAPESNDYFRIEQLLAEAGNNGKGSP